MKIFDFTQELLSLRGDLWSNACKLTADEDEAKDLLQDTLLKALENKDKYIEGTNFKAWLYVIMRNIFINNYRKKIRDIDLFVMWDSLPYFDLKNQDIFTFVDKDYDSQEIWDIMYKSMSKRDYEHFQMYLSGFKYREIADKTGVSLGTIKSRIFYCRKKLIKLLFDFI